MKLFTFAVLLWMFAPRKSLPETYSFQEFYSKDWDAISDRCL